MIKYPTDVSELGRRFSSYLNHVIFPVAPSPAIISNVRYTLLMKKKKSDLQSAAKQIKKPTALLQLEQPSSATTTSFMTKKKVSSQP